MFLLLAINVTTFMEKKLPHFWVYGVKFSFIASVASNFVAVWTVRDMKPQAERVKMTFSLENACPPKLKVWS